MESYIAGIVNELRRTNNLLETLTREIHLIGGDFEELKEAVEDMRR
jgi:hypothetical protein